MSIATFWEKSWYNYIAGTLGFEPRDNAKFEGHTKENTEIFFTVANWKDASNCLFLLDTDDLDPPYIE